MLIPGMLFEEHNSSKLYNEEIKNISNLMDELDLDNIHEIFYVYCYLLWNGYFSDNKKYIFDSTNIANEYLTIFLGKGCCRHNAKLLRDVIYFMDTYNQSARNISIYLKNSKIKGLTKIKRDINSNTTRTTFLQRLSEFRGRTNHEVTLVSDDGIILLDPTNPVECTIIDGKKIVCPNGKYKVDKKILEEELMTTYPPIDIKKTSILTKEELIESYELAKEILEKNKRLIEDFYDSNRNNLKEIKEYVYR